MTAQGMVAHDHHLQPEAGRDPPAPRWLWLIAAILPTAAWLLLVRVEAASLFLDWMIYRQGWLLWLSAGTPYQVLAPGWSPCQEFPYLYPPTSWPLLPLSAIVPPVAVGLGVLPLLLRAPRFWYVPIAAACVAVGLGPGLYLANVNLIVAGLLVLSFAPGRVGGIAFGLVVAIKLYPVVLLPLLWGDRSRLEWFVGVFGGLLASGTLLFGIEGWRDFATTLLNEGPHCAATWNPLANLGALRVLVASGIAVLGLSLRSPTLTLVGATWLSGVVTEHYLVTFAATLCVEPSLASMLTYVRRPRLAELLKPWTVWSSAPQRLH